jgi:hypothetical protein
MKSASRWFHYADYIKALKKTQNVRIDIKHSEHIQHCHNKYASLNGCCELSY